MTLGARVSGGSLERTTRSAADRAGLGAAGRVHLPAGVAFGAAFADVGDDADDAASWPSRRDAADGILAGPEAAGGGFVDDDDGLLLGSSSSQVYRGRGRRCMPMALR